VATEGFEGFYVETRNYGATAAFWASLGFEKISETGHGSGGWKHPSGGPYIFIVEQHDNELNTWPILHVTDAAGFSPSRPLEYLQPFTPQHWGVVEALVRDPDGRTVSLQAPLPEAETAPDAEAHHEQKYGAS